MTDPFRVMEECHRLAAENKQLREALTEVNQTARNALRGSVSKGHALDHIAKVTADDNG